MGRVPKEREGWGTREAYAALFRTNPFKTLIVRLSDRRLIDANEAALGYLGRKAGEILGKSLDEILGTRDTGLAAFLSSSMRGSSHKGRFRLGPGLAEERQVLVTFSPLEIGGEAYAFLVLSDEEEQGAAAQACQELGATERQALLRELDHRVRNNLQFLQSLINLEAGEGPGQERRRQVSDIEAKIHLLSDVYGICLDLENSGYVNARQLYEALARIPVQGSQTYVVHTDIDREVFIRLDQSLSLGLLYELIVESARRRAGPGHGLIMEIRGREAFNRSGIEIRDNARPQFERRSNSDLVMRAAAAQISAELEIEELPGGQGMIHRLTLPIYHHLRIL